MARMLGRTGLPLLGLLCGLSVGCDDGEKFYSVGPGGSKPGLIDWLFDGNPPSASNPDGGTGGEGPASDGGVGDDEDGGSDGPGGNDFVDLTKCLMAEEDRWQQVVEFSDEGGFDLQMGPTGFGLAYQDAGGCSYLEAMRIPSSGFFPGAHELKLRDNCVVVREAALLAHDGGWYTAWVDNSDGDGELFSARLDADMRFEPGSPIDQVTDNARTLAEKRPFTGAINGTPMLGWIGADGAKNDSLWMRRFDDGSEAVAVVDSADGRSPTRGAFGQVGSLEGNRRGAVAWVEPDEPGAQKGVWLQPLTADATLDGSPIRLSDRASVGQSVDLARHESGGAAVYTIDIDGVQQVRWRRLGLDGRPEGDERSIIGNPLRARDASIAPLSRGYVIAYRALVGGAIKEPEIRLTFITKDGNLNKDAGGNLITVPVAKASAASARLTVRVSNEGQIMVGWIDETAGGTTLHVNRQPLSCK